MFRARRYRVFLVIAVLAALTFYHLRNVHNWDSTTAPPVPQVKTPAGQQEVTGGDKKEEVVKQEPLKVDPVNQEITSSTSSTDVALQTSTTVEDVKAEITTNLAETTSTTSSSSSASTTSAANENAKGSTLDSTDSEFGPHGQGRLEAQPPKDGQQPHWQKQKEHFPIPEGSVTPLPTGKPKKIPKIQHDFSKDESTTQKIERERKQESVKEAFKHAWAGYKNKAMGHDELTPVSGEHKNPFNGWGATLVDTLDTLWIMGMKEEFEEAVQYVKKIDFTTSARKDIPLFETVIRYLGGLLGAYDVCEAQYRVLLDKAVELAEVLMGAFDTPNRMPITFYNWAPSYASQPHRASTRVVMAELGSLSVEFTRLAQLTKEAKYYDAIARITDELEKMQSKTQVPGLWPVHIDASGCKKPERPLAQIAHSNSKGPQNPLPGAADQLSSNKDKTVQGVAAKSDNTPSDSSNISPHLRKRQLDDSGKVSGGPSTPAPDEEPAIPVGKDKASGPKGAGAKSASGNQAQTPKTPSKPQKDTSESVDCEPQGLASPPYTEKEDFQIGGMADSTFEYLPKEYMLLGGLKDQYKEMYLDSADAIRTQLLFRPMLKDEERNVLFSAKLTTSSKEKKALAETDTSTSTSTKKDPQYKYEGQHLTCFAGGMFAVGAKIFELKEDLDIAAKLTDGCVWSYESTTTGIMAESFQMLPCEDKNKCPWNETAWYEALDPDRKSREESIVNWNENQQKIENQRLEELKAKNAAETDVQAEKSSSQVESSAGDSSSNVGSNGESNPTTNSESKEKRQIAKGHIRYEDDSSLNSAGSPDTSKDKVDEGNVPTKTKIQQVDGDETRADSAPGEISPLFTPLAIPDPVEFAKTKIKEGRLPAGVTKIDSRKYILRPEAIESVFIMYRVTGDEYWREKGWKMFNAIETHTRTELANSAIHDVTSAVPSYDDTMESFWLAETLKYFYLLYSSPDVISLDNYIL
ncbi:MAG: hypothetical protein Q9227_004023 [Pyrenula ochraceoflavens]